MTFRTLSAILRGNWLLNQEWASSQYPVVANLREGRPFEYSQKVSLNEKLTVANAGSPAYIQRISPFTRTEMLPMGSLVMVDVKGPILKEGDYCTYGSVDYCNLMNRLAAASNVAGVILNIDSPGGQADGTALFADSIRNLESKKPVISYVDDGMAASAAMWIASPATEIYCSQPTDQFGSIGVYTSVADWNAYYAAQGLPVKDVYAPQSTDKNLPYRAAIDGDTSLIEADLKVLCDQFIKTISTNRAGKIKGDSWKGGKLFYAAEAKSIGLIDGIKSLSQVVDRMNSLIKTRQQSNSNNMAFEQALVAAKATEFEVTDAGFLLTEAHLNNIDAAIISGNTAAQNLTVAESRVTELEGTNGTLETQLSESNNKVTGLEAEVTRLQGKSSGPAGSKLVSKADEQASSETKVPVYLDDNASINQYADKHLRKKSKD